MTGPQKIKLQWSTIHTAIESLAYQLEPLKPHLFIAIARGGLIPATLLSHKMNVDLEVIRAESYEGSRRLSEQKVKIEGWKDEYSNNNTVFIDDVIDSGETWRAIADRAQSSCLKYATIVNKQPAFIESINFCHVPLNVWIEFPWEDGES